MTLAQATEHYQHLLEGRRRLTEWDDHNLTDEVDTMLEEAHKAMETAWLQQLLTKQ